jgi:hypothetical protein
MTYDYKRLCNELLSYLYQCNWPDGERFYALVERTRAALAEPEPKTATKTELDKFVEEYWGSMKGFYPGGHETIYTPFELIAREHFTNFARDVLARWGNHPGSPDSSTPQPISVSESLPGPEDCDAKGRCWLFRLGQDGVGDWFQRAPYPSADAYQFFCVTHWLPGRALPQPS